MNNNIIYLENYVEGTTSLPPELSRILATIKALDDKTGQLQDAINSSVASCLSKAPQQSRKPNQPDEVAVLREHIESQQRLLIQFAEEKVELAMQGYGLLDMHLQRLNKELEQFEGELQNAGLLQDGVATELFAQQDEQQKRMPRMHSTRDLDAAPSIKRDIELDRRASRAPPADIDYAPSPAQETVHRIAQKNSKGVRNETPHVPKKKAQRSYPAGTEPDATASEDPAQHFVTPVAEGMQFSAAAPQAPGRLLTADDITPALAGRQAELFWPDDNLWYLIEIQTVDVEKQVAQILYTTGEAEELDLKEIIQEGHMSLITQ